MICKMSMTKTWHIKCSYNFSNSSDLQLYLQDSTSPWTTLPHRTPVALFWDLFRGLHLTSWRWMACRRSNYPHDLLGVSETLQPDYPRILPDHGWSTFSAMDDSFSSIIFNFFGPSSLSYQKSWRDFVFKNLRGTGSTICGVIGYQHLVNFIAICFVQCFLFVDIWTLTWICIRI